MTVDKCKKLCYEQNYLFAGLEFGAQCFCGNKSPLKSAPMRECHLPCTGNVTQVCGGHWRINIYSISPEFVPTTAPMTIDPTTAPMTTEPTTAPITHSNTTVIASTTKSANNISPILKFDGKRESTKIYCVRMYKLDNKH